APQPLPGATQPAILVSADFNGDGKLDVAGSLGGVVAVWIGDGLGGFSAPVEYLGGGAFAAADFNGDGRGDIVITDTGIRFVYSTSCVPTRLGVAVQPSTCNPTGTAFLVQPVVDVTDDGGNLVSCEADTVTASILNGTGTPGAVLGG